MYDNAVLSSQHGGDDDGLRESEAAESGFVSGFHAPPSTVKPIAVSVVTAASHLKSPAPSVASGSISGKLPKEQSSTSPDGTQSEDTASWDKPSTVYETSIFGHATIVSHSVMHKSRLHGKSHWLSSAVQVGPLHRHGLVRIAHTTQLHDILELMETHIRDDASKATRGLQSCKHLARVIKFRRKAITPSTPRASLPSRAVADELVECYLRTSEAIYRVLHIPAFKSEYALFWTSDSPDQTPFLAMLKLVLAIGAASYDQHFSLLTSAVQWVLETQGWLGSPEVKIKPNLQFLQIEVLLLLAKEEAKIGKTRTWISAGSLLRSAISQGLSHDPGCLPNVSLIFAEMRRRLWNTILEINLQTCIAMGGPPLISLDDFNTEPPGNFDDDQLLSADAVSRPGTIFTQSSVAIALRKTFSVRLAIAKYLNNPNSRGTYEETLRLDENLKAAYKALTQPFLSYNAGSGLRPSIYQLKMLDFIVYRYMLSLHVPFSALPVRNSTYAYSRTVVIDTSLKIWSTARPQTFTMASPWQSTQDAYPSSRDDLARLTICGNGFLRSTAMQACLLLALELRTELVQESLGPAPLRPDLLATLVDSKEWALECIRAGETNTKAYLAICLATAHIQGLRQRLGKENLVELMLKTLEEAEQDCLHILEEQAAQVDDDAMTVELPSEEADMLDWNLLVSLNHRHRSSGPF